MFKGQDSLLQYLEIWKSELMVRKETGCGFPFSPTTILHGKEFKMSTYTTNLKQKINGLELMSVFAIFLM